MYQGIFSPVFTRTRLFQAPKTQVPRERSPEWTFENADFSYCVCSVRDANIFQSFQCFYVDGRKKDSNTLSVDAFFGYV